ncbi:MAG: methyltransferase domain-containing protein [Proteobacteria bacterium]|nr:methyltransferase domain-containing protein [Pseudomonadota bacterium]
MAVTPGPAYQAASFHERAVQNGFRVLDTGLFTKRLGSLLASVFGHMLAFIAAAVVVLLVLLFLDLRLIAVSLVPLAFALVSTLGTLKLMGRPLDIPALMLGVVVFGMGVDYSLFLVRAYQRFGGDRGSSLGPVMTTVGVAGGSTLIGLLSLALAQHAVLQSAGIISMLGVGYCLVGSFVILPPLLRRIFAPRPWPAEKLTPGSSRHNALTRGRYRYLDVYTRMFARFKVALDPMFGRLYDFVPAQGTVLDVGCGYGIQAAWLMTIHPSLEIRGIEPDPGRAGVAGRVLAPRGRVEVGRAPDLPADPARVETILFLDVAHYLTDHQLKLTLDNMVVKLAAGGRLVMRLTVPGAGRVAWQRRLEHFKTKLRGQAVYFRSAAEIEAILSRAGLTVMIVEPTAPNREETWFVAGIDDRISVPGGRDR